MALERHLKILDSGTEAKWVDAAIRVAFASTDMKQVNQHFGYAESFAIYAVDLEHIQLMEVSQFGKPEQDGPNSSGTNLVAQSASEGASPGKASNSEDKLAAKLSALEGCVAVYAQAAGASAVTQLKARGIQPVKVSQGADILYLLKSLQEELRMGPSAWLARAIDSQRSVDPSRFDMMEDEGWNE